MAHLRDMATERKFNNRVEAVKEDQTFRGFLRSAETIKDKLNKASYYHDAAADMMAEQVHLDRKFFFLCKDELSFSTVRFKEVQEGKTEKFWDLFSSHGHPILNPKNRCFVEYILSDKHCISTMRCSQRRLRMNCKHNRQERIKGNN